MIAKILAFFWLILGIFWLIKPQSLSSRMMRKTTRKLSWPVYGLLFFLALNLLGVVFKFEGLIYKLLGILGIFLLVHFTLKIQSEAMDQFRAWWSKIPQYAFRLWALFCIGLGIFILYFNQG